MARRKTSEVLMTGEKIDPRNTVSATTSDNVGTSKTKNRRKPRVIDFVGDRTRPPAVPKKQSEASPPEKPSNQPITLKAEHPPIPKPKPGNGSIRINPDQQSMVLAETIVSSIVGEMKSQADRNGGYLSVDGIEQLHNKFRRQTTALSQIFSQSFEAYVRARERANWEQKRDFPFDRIMVKNFSHLFSEGSPSDFNRVSRRMLPGFFMAIGMMLGPDVVEEFQEKCRGEVENTRLEKGAAFVWEDVYGRIGVQTIGFDAMIAIIRHFDDFEKRAQWFSDLVNGHLTPPEASDNKDKGWEMTPGALKLFLRTLFHDLFKALNDETEKQKLIKRHGLEACEIALEVQEKTRL